MLNTYKNMFDDVVQSGKYHGAEAKVKRLAALIFYNDRSRSKMDCIFEALEKYEEMTGIFFDPTQEQLDYIIHSII